MTTMALQFLLEGRIGTILCFDVLTTVEYLSNRNVFIGQNLNVVCAWARPMFSAIKTSDKNVCQASIN